MPRRVAAGAQERDTRQHLPIVFDEIDEADRPDENEPVIEYSEDAKDPHTIAFDQKGDLWFTLQNSNMVGRLNPTTGEIKLVKMPPNAPPMDTIK